MTTFMTANVFMVLTPSRGKIMWIVVMVTRTMMAIPRFSHSLVVAPAVIQMYSLKAMQPEAIPSY